MFPDIVCDTSEKNEIFRIKVANSWVNLIARQKFSIVTLKQTAIIFNLWP